MENFLIDSEIQYKHDKKNIRPAVSLSGELVPLQYFLQTTCRPTGVNSCTWFTSSVKFSPYQENLFHAIIFLRHSFTILGNLIHLNGFHRQADSSI